MCLRMIMVSMIITAGIWIKGANVSGQVVTQAGFKPTAGKTTCMRIDVDIYAKVTAPPLEQYKTYFTETLTIETDQTNSLVKVLDRVNRTLTVADMTRRVCFVVELDSLDAMMVELNALTVNSSKKPESKQDVQVISQDNIRIENEQVVYEAKLAKGPFNEMTLRYLEHVDWSTKIAAVFPPKRPPQIRLALNDYLIEQQALPIELKRKIKATKSSDEIVAKLVIPTTPSSADETTVERILASVRELKVVAAQDYFK